MAAETLTVVSYLRQNRVRFSELLEFVSRVTAMHVTRSMSCNSHAAFFRHTLVRHDGNVRSPERMKPECPHVPRCTFTLASHTFAELGVFNSRGDHQLTKLLGQIRN